MHFYMDIHVGVFVQYVYLFDPLHITRNRGKFTVIDIIISQINVADSFNLIIN